MHETMIKGTDDAQLRSKRKAANQLLNKFGKRKADAFLSILEARICLLFTYLATDIYPPLPPPQNALRNQLITSLFSEERMDGLGTSIEACEDKKLKAAYTQVVDSIEAETAAILDERATKKLSEAERERSAQEAARTRFCLDGGDSELQKENQKLPAELQHLVKFLSVFYRQPVTLKNVEGFLGEEATRGLALLGGQGRLIMESLVEQSVLM